MHELGNAGTVHMLADSHSRFGRGRAATSDFRGSVDIASNMLGSWHTVR